MGDRTEYFSKYYQEHKSECKENHKNWLVLNKDYMPEYHKKYQYINKVTETKRKMRWAKDNISKVKQSHKKWRQNNPDKWNLNNKKIRARRRYMGFNKLCENPFPSNIEIEWHHINNIDVIPLPKEIHRLCTTGSNVELHRELCKSWVIYMSIMYI